MNHPQPGPLQRRGPRPLLLHLMLAGLSSMSSVAASMTSKPGWPLWNPELAEALRTLLAGAGENAAGFPAAVLAETLARDSALLAGIAAYRRHPWHRDLADPPAIWAEGESRVLDFGGSGRPMLFVPSLVNRATVLDLAPGQSMLRWIAAQGQRALLLDWGWPGPVERAFDLTDYVAGRLERALAAVGEQVVLVGYCMGGLLTLAATQRQQARVAGLALLATPWDFHAGAPDRSAQAAGLLQMLEPAMTLAGALPIDALQTLFALLDPWGVGEKYRRFARLDQTSARAVMFVAVEDWLNDGVPLAAPVARQVLGEWYGENRPARGVWRVAGEVVDPARLAVPSFVAIPARDRIVPPESAEPLAAILEAATIHRPAAGHVGMVAGSGAQRALWQPLLAWGNSLNKS